MVRSTKTAGVQSTTDHAREKAPYMAFLIRCRREGAVARESIWRFQVIEVGGEQHRRYFTDLEGIIAYLRSRLECNGEPGEVGQASQASQASQDSEESWFPATTSY